mgnify:CR=1 FL=1
MLRSYKTRRGRLTARQQRELAIDDGLLLRPDPDRCYRTLGEIGALAVLFAGRPVIVEIGFGAGPATAERASREPDVGVLAVDVHTPGVADLLGEIRSRALTNVRIVEDDAVRVLAALPANALVGARTFFPDPWPKARHHKRRLVQPPFISLLASRVCSGGIWELATDWPDYADQMGTVIPAAGLWTGGSVPRPDRPVTHFERRAVRAGREVVDLVFERSSRPAVWTEPVTAVRRSNDRPAAQGVAGESR